MVESAIRTGRARGVLVGESVPDDVPLGVRVMDGEGEEDTPMLPKK